jgi:phosphate starvation-inducible protein PhoH and related proteins
MVKKKIFLTDKDEVVSLLGEYDSNARRIEEKYGVGVLCTENGKLQKFVIEVNGPKAGVGRAYAELLGLQARGMRERPEKPSPYGARPFALPARHLPGKAAGDAVLTAFNGRPIAPLTRSQKDYIEAMRTHDLVVGIGPAGTGKTFLAVAQAIAALESGEVNKIVLTRPVVESGEKLGFLPGDLNEKINPYLKPLYDAFYGMLGPERFQRCRADEIVEIVPLAYMRGRTLEDAFIILDEAQNTVPEQMKMFLTRTGCNSRVVVTGDITQIDLEKKKRSGLVLIREILAGIEGIAFVRFTDKDIVRHKLVKDIIKAYERWEDANGD